MDFGGACALAWRQTFRATRTAPLIPVFVINLPRSGERRAFMETQLGALGVPFGFFTAIDGTQVPPSARAKYDPSIPIGFVGCGESHLALLRQIRDGDSEFVCVLEDDAVVAPTTLQLLDPATLRSLSRFDVLRLESYPRRGKRLMLPIAKRYPTRIILLSAIRLALTT